MGEIRLSCYTAPWKGGNLIPAITDIAEAGFRGVECPDSVVDDYEDRLHVFEEILETSRLELSGLVQTINVIDRDAADLQVERAANAARFAGAAGAKVLTVCHCEEREAPLTDEEWAAAGAMLEEIGERCREFGVRLCYLPRAQRLIGNEKEIRRLCASVNAELVSLALDTAELQLAGCAPQKVIKANFDRIKSVRYRDASASKRRSKSTSDKPGATPQFGRGGVNFEATSKTLLECGYEGWISLDVSGEASEPADAIANGFRFLMRKSGLFDF